MFTYFKPCLFSVWLCNVFCVYILCTCAGVCGDMNPYVCLVVWSPEITFDACSLPCNWDSYGACSWIQQEQLVNKLQWHAFLSLVRSGIPDMYCHVASCSVCELELRPSYLNSNCLSHWVISTSLNHYVNIVGIFLWL